MATTLGQDDIDNSDETLSIANKILESLKERRFINGKISEDEKLMLRTMGEVQRLSLKITANADAYLNFQIKSKDLSKQILAVEDQIAKSIYLKNRNQTELNNQLRDSQSLQASLQHDLQNANQDLIQAEIDKINALQRYINLNAIGSTATAAQIAAAKTEAAYREDIYKTSIREVDSLEKKVQIQDKLTASLQESIHGMIDVLGPLAHEWETLQRALDVRRSVESSMGILGVVSKTLSKIPGLGSYLKTDEANQEMEELAGKIEAAGDNATSFVNRMRIFGTGMKVIGQGLLEAMTGPEAVFSFLIANGLKASSQFTTLSKALMLTKGEANAVRNEFVWMDRVTGDSSITVDRLVESYGKLTSMLGFNVPRSRELLVEFTKLTKNMGVSEQAAAGLARLTLSTGKAARLVTTESLATAQSLQSQYGIQLDNRDILDEVGKVSGQLLANFRLNPSAIAEAVTQAKLLGTSLEQTKKQSETLLNFESSIENELKAELLVGQQMNLERARAAALMGNQLDVMKELSSQNMNYSKFSEMNVIAQKSFAEALGLTSDELADQLLKQQYMGRNLAEVAALEGEAAAKRLESLDASEKFNNAIEKLQSLLGNLMAGPMGQLVEALADVASNTTLIYATMGALGGYMVSGMIPAMMRMLSVMRTMRATSIATAIAEIVAGAWKSMGGLPVVGPILAGAAIAGGVGYLMTRADDMMSPGDGSTGYGKRTLMGPEGAIQLNNKDTVIAGTDLFKGDSINSSVDLTPMIMAINEVRNAINNMNNKETSIYLDGKKVGTSLAQGSGKLA